MFENIFRMLFGNHNQNNRYTQSCRSRCAPRFVYQLVPFEQAKAMIEEDKVTLIDVRTENEYDLMHIKNAINIPVDDIEKKIFMYEQTCPIMIYCSSGARSKTALQILNQLGYTNIYIWEYGALATFPYKNMLVYGENVRRGNENGKTY